MTSQSLGEVVESQDGRFSPGDLVVGQLGWQEYAVARGGAVRKVPEFLDPPTLALHVVGMTGMTAYFGLLDVGKPLPGDTVVVSGAAGAVGQVVGQIAKLAGCRTVGIAGGPDKCTDCTVYGYDVAIDYKDEGFREALKAACPTAWTCTSTTSAARSRRGCTPPAQRRRADRDLRADLPVQPRPARADVPPEPADRLSSAHGGLPRHRLRPSVPGSAVRLARWVAERKISWREDVTEGLGEHPGRLHGDAPRRESRQGARQGGRARG